MSTFNKIQNYFRRSREKHKLTFVDDTNFTEKWSFKVSSFNLFFLVALYSILLIVLLTLLIKFTPLKSVFTGEGNYENSLAIEENEQLIDSLIIASAANDLYLANLKKILNDEDFTDSTLSAGNDSLENYNPNFTKAESDSMLRLKVENSISNNSRYAENESYEFFFSPVNGLVSRSFDEINSHIGVDIVTLEDEVIKSCLDGTIIFTGWVQSEGHIVVVQHRGDLISIYKHCSAILKLKGETVKTGDPIAIVGNSGENTTGPHLHFELWKKGKAINPEDYISF